MRGVAFATSDNEGLLRVQTMSVCYEFSCYEFR